MVAATVPSTDCPARGGHVPDLDGERPALTGDHGCIVQHARDRGAVERCGHDEQSQLGAKHRLRLQGESQTEVCVEVALVEFVEDHEAHALERCIREQHAREHAFGNDLDACARADPCLSAHAETHRGTDRLAK
jgi:hypothetical protein